MTSSKRTAWYQKNWEIHWYPETSANKAKIKSLTRIPTAEKTVKERDRTQMPAWQKERPNHECWWQTKNGCPNQSSKQLTPNERNKTAETTSKPQTVCLPASTRWKKHIHKNTTKSQQSNRLLSATKEWTTTVRRAPSKYNCANDKQMENQTNHN